MADAALMAGKTVLITGGTGGIGKATAIGLAAMGAHVGITGRDRARAEAAAAEIRAASGNPAVDAFAADMSSQAEVRRLAAQVLDAYPRLDVLINNVGGFWAHRTSPPMAWSARSPSTTWPAPATSLLLERLKASAPHESSPSPPAPRRWADRLRGPARRHDYSGSAPTTSRNWPTSCSPTSWPAAWKDWCDRDLCHPGVVLTRPSAPRTGLGHFRHEPGPLCMKTPAEGAATSIYLASSP